MVTYGAYHRNPKNRLTHFIGVPMITFALLIPLSWVDVPGLATSVTLAMVLVAAVLVYYFFLDTVLAVAMTMVMAALLAAAHWMAMSHPPSTGWLVFTSCFVGGWILQLAGHVFEGRRPALTDNIWQVFVAPIFLMAEVFFALGFKTDIKEQVEAQLREDRT